jgi:hypothetical protein
MALPKLTTPTYELEIPSTDEKIMKVLQHAGRALGSHCVAMLRAIDPQCILLTGPLGRSSIFGKAFCKQLVESGVTTKVITANDQPIFPPAIAASALSLVENIYSPTFDVQKLLTQKLMSKSTSKNSEEFV